LKFRILGGIFNVMVSGVGRLGCFSALPPEAHCRWRCGRRPRAQVAGARAHSKLRRRRTVDSAVAGGHALGVTKNTLIWREIQFQYRKMKTRRYVVPVWVALMVLAACNRATPEKAVAYNDAIVSIQSRVVGYFDSFVLAAERGDSVVATRALGEAIDSSKVGMDRLQAMEAFDGSTQLRDAAKELVAHYIKGLDQDFRGILPVLISDSASLADLQRAESVRQAFEAEEDRLFKVVEVAQKAMAEKYKFEFEGEPEDETGDQLEE
jgi:hypothetical protein